MDEIVIKGMDKDGPLPLHWMDRGCDLAPSCLACPFPSCRYDTPVVSLKRQQKDREVALAHKSGVSAVDLAQQYQEPLETVYRRLRRYRQEAARWEGK